MAEDSQTIEPPKPVLEADDREYSIGAEAPDGGSLPAANLSFSLPWHNKSDEIVLVPRDVAQKPVLDYATLRTLSATPNGDMFAVASKMLEMDLEANTPAGRAKLASLGIPTDHAWCAEFMNTVAKLSGVQGTGSAMATSFQNWGQKIDKPEKGCVVVYHDRDGSHGHVGLVAGITRDGKILTLGGNQGNELCIVPFDPNNFASVDFIRPPPGKDDPAFRLADKPEPTIAVASGGKLAAMHQPSSIPTAKSAQIASVKPPVPSPFDGHIA